MRLDRLAFCLATLFVILSINKCTSLDFDSSESQPASIEDNEDNNLARQHIIYYRGKRGILGNKNSDDVLSVFRSKRLLPIPISTSSKKSVEIFSNENKTELDSAETSQNQKCRNSTLQPNPSVIPSNFICQFWSVGDNSGSSTGPYGDKCTCNWKEFHNCLCNDELGWTVCLNLCTVKLQDKKADNDSEEE